jgi:hypothetical protein
MTLSDKALAALLLQAMARVYPEHLHFGFFGLAIGATSGCVYRALRELLTWSYECVDRSSNVPDVPWFRPQLTSKGLLRAAQLAADPRDEFVGLAHQ